VSIIAGHEYIETLTDPVVDAGWIDSNSRESADKCEWLTSGPGAMGDLHLSTGTFAVQSTWSDAANNGLGGCVTHQR
jgi:serine protease